jgi:hypothetical protein
MGGPADETAIAAAEDLLGGRFPSHYRRFLGEFGWLEFASVSVFGLGDCPSYLDS